MSISKSDKQGNLDSTGSRQQAHAKEHRTKEDLENQSAQEPSSNAGPETETEQAQDEKNVSVLKGLGWLDRFLALWIFLAMVLGILLGNFVPNTSEALEKGKFVDVSIPIGKLFLIHSFDPSSYQRRYSLTTYCPTSCRVARHDVPHLMQCQVRITPLHPSRQGPVETTALQHPRQLDHRPFSHGS